MTEEEKSLVSELDGFKTKFIESMEDDVNTADAISVIFELAKFTNSNVNEKSSLEFAKKCLDELSVVKFVVLKPKAHHFFSCQLFYVVLFISIFRHFKV